MKHRHGHLRVADYSRVQVRRPTTALSEQSNPDRPCNAPRNGRTASADAHRTRAHNAVAPSDSRAPDQHIWSAKETFSERRPGEPAVNLIASPPEMTKKEPRVSGGRGPEPERRRRRRHASTRLPSTWARRADSSVARGTSPVPAAPSAATRSTRASAGTWTAAPAGGHRHTGRATVTESRSRGPWLTPISRPRLRSPPAP